jgi:putative peptidoglycan lipid II flippase
VIRATTGVWLNYATTFVFQIVFAFRYGSGKDASVFVIVFGLGIAVGGVVTASVQSVIVPRLLTETGRLARPALRLLWMFTLMAVAAVALLWTEARAISEALALHTDLPRTAFYEPLRAACPFVLLQVIAGELIAINIAVGRRFAPAVAPALPSLAAAVSLLLWSDVSVPTLFTAFLVGTALEVVVLLYAFAVTVAARWRPVPSRLPRASVLAFATAAQLTLLALLPLLERVMASVHSTGGAADYNYAIRSLAVVQQLIVGGWLLSSLGDWSDFARTREQSRFRASLLRTTTAAALLLVLAASIAIVAGPRLIALVYEHGSFTSKDTRAVASLVLLALGGFCAEGVGLVLSQALVAYRRNGSAIAIGVFAFLVRAALVLLFGKAWGARGVAIAYSVSAGLALLVQVVVIGILSLAARSDLARFGRGGLVALGTLATAGMCVLLRSFVPSAAQAIVVVAAFVALFAIAKPESPFELRDA